MTRKPRPKRPPFERLDRHDDHYRRLMEVLSTAAKIAGKTPKDLAAAIQRQPSTVIKYLRGDRMMPNWVLVEITKELGWTKVLGPKVASAILPGLIADETGSWPPRFAPGDIEFLESISDPCFYSKSPEGRIMRVNRAFREYFPWMPEPTLENPVDMPVEIFTNPGARESFGDSWSTLASHTAQSMLIFCPAVVPTERMEELFARCGENPEFFEFLAKMPTAEDFNDTIVEVLCPDGKRRRHVIKALVQAWNDPEAWTLNTMTRIDP